MEIAQHTAALPNLTAILPLCLAHVQEKQPKIHGDPTHCSAALCVELALQFLTILCLLSNSRQGEGRQVGNREECKSALLFTINSDHTTLLEEDKRRAIV